MLAAPLRGTEAASLAALNDLKVLDTAPEPEFDAVVRAASAVCGTPISLISLIDVDRQWFKANVGLPGIDQMPRHESFCAHAVLSEDLLEVPDALLDARFADNPLVTGRPDIRFYAGAPVILRSGLCIGTLCVIDTVPHRLDAAQQETLRALSRTVAHALEGRQAIRDTLRLAAQLSEQNELLRVTLESVADGIATTDADGRIDYLNPVAQRLTGWSAHEAKDVHCTDVFRVVTRPGERLGHASGQDVLHSRTGQSYAIEKSVAPIRTGDGGVSGHICVFRDVTEQRRLFEQIAHRATHDSLTGLFNREEFEAQIRRALQAARDTSAAHALMFIDLDQFKRVNDACGHAAGDELLKQFALLLVGVVRSGDRVARLGGDEFAVLLEDCPMESAASLAQELCDLMDDFRFTHEGSRFRVGTSIGLVRVDSRWHTEIAALQAADASCFAAKEAGRNRVHLWLDTDMALQARQSGLKWATEIERALDEDRFVLYAQRIAPLGHTAGGAHAEVLVRMIGRDGTVIQPGTFLPAAERYDLAPKIDRWVVLRALDWLGQPAHRQAVETLSVNMSGRSLEDPAFHAWTYAKLDAVGPALCAKLCFEITETAAMGNLAQASAFIAALRLRGVRIALDDFGAGASSFGYLKRLAVDYLKIDGQFVRGLLTEVLDDAALRCFVDVAKVVGMKTIAECVESRAVMRRLEQMGVDFVQGDHIQRALPIDDLLTFVAADDPQEISAAAGMKEFPE